MADWFIRFFAASQGFNQPVGEFSLQEPDIEVRNSEPGGFTGSLALSQTTRDTEVAITRDQFGPYRTWYQVMRQTPGSASICISEGMLTSLNLNFNRDTALISGKDWLHYMERRIYPFDPEKYVDPVEQGFRQWPRQWPDIEGNFGPRDFVALPTSFDRANKLDVGIIVREIFQSMRFEPPPVLLTVGDHPLSYQWPGGPTDTTDGVPPFVQSIPDLGVQMQYKIYPGDQTSIYDHIKTISQQVDRGFEFDILPISREFKLWYPRRDIQTIPYFTITPTEDEANGAIIDFDWTNEGPNGTYIVGLGQGKHKFGAVFTTFPNVLEFSRLDKVYDFGELGPNDNILQMIKNQRDLDPQKKLTLKLLNPEFFGINFYTGGRPRGLIGRLIRVTHDFAPLHLVDAYFAINAIKWNVDASTNEEVELELEMIYDYEPLART